jgi:hypothetical protein
MRPTTTGEVGTAVNYGFDSSEGRDLLRDVLKEIRPAAPRLV